MTGGVTVQQKVKPSAEQDPFPIISFIRLGQEIADQLGPDV